MRASVLALVAAGCLAVPPGAEEGDAAGSDGSPPVAVDDAGDPVTGCPEGSELDLAYLSRVGLVGDGSSTQLSLADIAVVINPGPDPLETDRLTAAVRTADGIVASIDVTARDGHLSLPPEQAHGALAVDYAAKVLSDVDETWTDYAYPALAANLSIAGALDGETDLVLDLFIDRYHFEAPITLVPGSPFEAQGLDADRISARCGE